MNTEVSMFDPIGGHPQPGAPVDIIHWFLLVLLLVALVAAAVSLLANVSLWLRVRTVAGEDKATAAAGVREAAIKGAAVLLASVLAGGLLFLPGWLAAL